jgi:hypothetical protein
MEEPALSDTETNVSGLAAADRISGLHEVMFCLNIAAALGYALLVYLSKNLGAFTPANDSMYYFLRSAFKIDDLLHLPSTNPISTSALAREYPSRASQIGDELLILTLVLAAASLVLLLLRITNGRSGYRIMLSRVAGVTALFAMPACFLLVLGLTWKWPSEPLSVPSYPIWQNPRLIVFVAEILSFGILFGIRNRRSIPAWILNTLLFLHYAFWVPVLLPEVRISMYTLYAPYFLLFLFPLSGIVWLRYLKTPRSHATDSRGGERVDKWSLATGIVAIALLILVWLPDRGESLARAEDIDSLTIHLSRGPCFGRCPSYTIAIHGNGLVEYSGKRYVGVPGSQTITINREQVIKIVQSLDRVRFFALEDRAFMWCFDTGSVTVTVSGDGTTKRVASDDSCTGSKSGLQAQFVKSAAEIDTIVDSTRWVDCEGRCPQ